jgi:hypothetical protein
VEREFLPIFVIEVNTKDMKTLDSKAKVSTKVLREVELDSKNKLSIEKILEGEYKGHYIIKSFTKKLFGFKNSSLAAYNVETDFEGDRIVKIEYGVFRMLDQAVNFAKEVKKNRYTKNY